MVNLFVVKPYLVRLRFKKYKNVGMNEQYHPVVGDLADIYRWLREGKYVFYYIIEYVQKHPEVDLFISQYGKKTLISPCSVRAYTELEKLAPEKVDRIDSPENPVSRMAPGSLINMISTPEWDKRRKNLLKTIGINFCSRFIDMMNRWVDNELSHYKPGDRVDLIDVTGHITFSIIAKIFLGQDIYEKISKFKYTDPNTCQVSYVDFQEGLSKIFMNVNSESRDIKGRLFPFLMHYNLVNPFKTNQANVEELIKTVSSFMDISDDKESVFRIIYESGVWTKDECVRDTLMMLTAGFDTTSRAVSSTLYFLKKNPEKLEKVMSAIKGSNLHNIDSIPKEKQKDAYESWDYLFYAWKEAFRMDPAAVTSMTYMALDNINICDVPIQKGEQLIINILYTHHNPEIYKEPLEFVPDRFDPNSELFTKTIKSWLPFSFGMRNCLGQTLAKLESKVIISRILTKLDFEVDAEIIKNNYTRFGMHSVSKLMCTIKKVTLD